MIARKPARVSGSARRLGVPMLAAVLAGLAPGCGGEGPDARGSSAEEGGASPAERSRATVRDQAGRTVELDPDPQRIISLVPAATDVLLELGLGNRIVARTDYDDQAEVSALPSVGGGLDPVLERLVELRPDLVVRFEGVGDRATPAALDRAGLTHLGVRPDRIEDVHEMIRILGAATDRADRARALSARIERELDAVRSRVEGATPPSVAFLLGGDPPWVAGPRTYLDELLGIAGGRNALDDLGRPGAPLQVSVETIVHREVDLLLAPEGTRVPPALLHIPIRRLPQSVQQAGPYLGRSAREISRALHPERWE